MTDLNPETVELGFYWARHSSTGDITIVEKQSFVGYVHFVFLGSEEHRAPNEIAASDYVLLGRINPPKLGF